jgi:dTDP-4-amino-4,6-dideoxygalactose transaminase
MGPYLREFERAFQDYLSIKHAFGVCNASCALELAAMISGVDPGDEVIVPAHTFTASALPFIRLKAKIVFADIDPQTFVMDVADVERKLTPRTKAVVAVHLYGVPVDMDALTALARTRGLMVIEDCAQSPGAQWNGKKTGVFGDFGCFSFHGQKNLTTLGEGGMIVTNRDDYADKILGLRKIGQRPFVNQSKYWLPAMSNIVEAAPGLVPYNFALGEIQAKAGTILLDRLDEINRKRRETFTKITGALGGRKALEFQASPPKALSAVHLLPARFTPAWPGKTRNDLIETLFHDFQIKCVVQYYPLYRYELFQKHGYRDDGSCPETNRFFDSMISFPFGSDFSDHEVDYLISSIDTALGRLEAW